MVSSWIRGDFEACGVFYPASVPASIARGRILENWANGDQVYPVGDGLFHRFIRGRRLRAEEGAGWLVFERGGRLSVDPEVFPDAPGVLGGRADGIRLERPIGSELNPADWLLIGPHEILEVVSLGSPPKPLAPAVSRPDAAPKIDLREAAQLPAPDLERMRSLRAELKAGALRGRRVQDLSGQSRTRGSWWSRFWGSSRGPDGGGRGPLLGPGGSGRARRGGEGISPRRSWRQWFGWLGVSPVAWERHDSVLNALEALFRQGDLEEALRFAIPLSKDSVLSEKELEPSPRLERRETLEFGPRDAPAGSSVLGDTSQLAALRRHYRSAFQKLKQAGEVRSAAFVLGELLGAYDEAVSYLEMEGAYALAAELAEAKQFYPAVRARLWLRAGAPERAAEIARRHDVFANVVNALQKTDGHLASGLAKAWASVLAGRGDYVNAVRVAREWDLPNFEAWVLEGLDMGGVVEAELLPSALAVSFESLAEISDEVLAPPESLLGRFRSLLGASGVAGSEARRIFVRGLQKQKLPEPWGAQLSNAIVRSALARDLESYEVVSELENLAQASPAVKAQLRAVKAPPRSPAGDGPVDLRVSAPDRGREAISDAVRLQSGRWLVALGEAGMGVLDRDGRPLVRRPGWAASRIVPSLSGHQALVLNPRGLITQVHLFDARTYAYRTLGELELGAWSTRFDGCEWAVVLGPRRVPVLLAVEDTGFRLVFEGSGQNVQGLQCVSSNRLASWRMDEESGRAWLEAYDLERGRLEERRELAVGPQILARSLEPNRTIEYTQAHGVSEGSGPGRRPSPVQPEPGFERLTAGYLGARRWYWLARGPEGTEVAVYAQGVGLAVRCFLEGASSASVNVHEAWTTISDPLGRIETFGPERGSARL